MERNLTCIICPMGCNLKVTMDCNEVLDIWGNQCPRGAKYAKMECTDPHRMVTTTMRCSDDTMISVKTSAPIPKKYVKSCVDRINEVTIAGPVSIGDVLLRDIFGIDIIATQSYPRKG